METNLTPNTLPWRRVTGPGGKPEPMLAKASDGMFEYVVWVLDSLKWPGYQSFTASMRTNVSRRIREHRRLEEIPTLEQALYLCQIWAMAGDPRLLNQPDDPSIIGNRRRAAA